MHNSVKTYIKFAEFTLIGGIYFKGHVFLGYLSKCYVEMPIHSFTQDISHKRRGWYMPDPYKIKVWSAVSSQLLQNRKYFQYIANVSCFF